MKTNENFQLSTFNFQPDKRLAVVILNWNGRALMEEFLPSVVACTPGEWADVIVADNGSTDDSIEMLKTKFPTVGIIRLDKNYGFAEGYNQALKHIGHEYTVLLNSDVEVTPGWLDAPIAALDADKTIAGVQPKIRAQRNKEYFEYAGAAGGYMDRYGYPYCRGRVLHVVEKDAGRERTEVIQEEIDLCWRLRSRGYRLVCTPSSVVYHVGGATLNVESPRKTFLNFRNNLLMLYKNLPEKDLKHVMHARFWLDYIAAAKFLLTGHYPNARAVYEARKAFHELKPSYEPVRRENLAKTKLSGIPELRKGSLILAFYLQGKKRFTEL